MLTEVGTAMADANDQLEGANPTNNDPNEQRGLLARQFQQRGSSRGFSFIINDDVGSTAEFGQGADYTEGLDTESVPESLREHFTEVADTAWTYTQIRQAGQPTVPGIVENVGGGNPLAVALSINIGSHLVDVSPLSTLGALCVAAVRSKTDRNCVLDAERL